MGCNVWGRITLKRWSWHLHLKILYIATKYIFTYTANFIHFTEYAKTFEMIKVILIYQICGP